MTHEPDELDKALDVFKAKMWWAPDTPDDIKTAVLGNLNGFVGHLRNCGRYELLPMSQRLR